MRPNVTEGNKGQWGMEGKRFAMVIKRSSRGQERPTGNRVTLIDMHSSMRTKCQDETRGYVELVPVSKCISKTLRSPKQINKIQETMAKGQQNFV